MMSNTQVQRLKFLPVDVKYLPPDGKLL